MIQRGVTLQSVRLPSVIQVDAMEMKLPSVARALIRAHGMVGPETGLGAVMGAQRARGRGPGFALSRLAALGSLWRGM